MKLSSDQNVHRSEAKTYEIIGGFRDSELVVGLIHSVGTDHKAVIEELKKRLKQLQYDSYVIHISKEVIPFVLDRDIQPGCDEYTRINTLIDFGNEAREKFNNTGILSLGVIEKINNIRKTVGKENAPNPRKAYIVSSLKHPGEVSLLVSFQVWGIAAPAMDSGSS